jgi:hypothetical protein
LVAGRGNGGADDGRDVPVAGRGMLNLDQKDDGTANGQAVANVAEPEAVFRCWERATGSTTAGLPKHPGVGHVATNLFAQQGAHNGADLLEANLLSVEVEESREDLWNQNGAHDAAPEVDHGVGDSRYHYAGAGNLEGGTDKV